MGADVRRSRQKQLNQGNLLFFLTSANAEIEAYIAKILVKKKGKNRVDTRAPEYGRSL